MTSSIYIVEDEPLIAETIKIALEKHQYIVCGISDNTKEAIYDIEELEPDLVLIDITLSGDLDGVDLAKKLDAKQPHLPYIFLTSSSDPGTINKVKDTLHAGFIHKPFNEGGLKSNIELALHKAAKAHSKENEDSASSLFVKDKGRLHKIYIDDIALVIAEDNYAYLITSNKKILLSQTLKSIEKKLASPPFIRIHRSFLVNMDKIESVSDGYVFISTHKVPIGKSYRQDFFRKIKLL